MGKGKGSNLNTQALAYTARARGEGRRGALSSPGSRAALGRPRCWRDAHAHDAGHAQPYLLGFPCPLAQDGPLRRCHAGAWVRGPSSSSMFACALDSQSLTSPLVVTRAAHGTAARLWGRGTEPPARALPPHSPSIIPIELPVTTFSPQSPARQRRPEGFWGRLRKLRAAVWSRCGGGGACR